MKYFFTKLLTSLKLALYVYVMWFLVFGFLFWIKPRTIEALYWPALLGIIPALGSFVAMWRHL
jgi:hypothetical protein